MVNIVRIIEWFIDFQNKELWNKMNWTMTHNLQQQSDLEANHQIIKRQIEDNLENGEEYVGLTKTSYHNLMLDRWVLRMKERLIGHMSFLPQGVVWHKYGLGVFKEGTFIDDDFHIKRCS